MQIGLHVWYVHLCILCRCVHSCCICIVWTYTLCFVVLFLICAGNFDNRERPQGQRTYETQVRRVILSMLTSLSSNSATHFSFLRTEAGQTAGLLRWESSSFQGTLMRVTGKSCLLTRIWNMPAQHLTVSWVRSFLPLLLSFPPVFFLTLVCLSPIRTVP